MIKYSVGIGLKGPERTRIAQLGTPYSILAPFGRGAAALVHEVVRMFRRRSARDLEADLREVEERIAAHPLASKRVVEAQKVVGGHDPRTKRRSPPVWPNADCRACRHSARSSFTIPQAGGGSTGIKSVSLADQESNNAPPFFL